MTQPPPGIFVVHHRDCGHIAAIHNDRRDAEKVRIMLGHAWRIRSGASDEDIAALMRQDSCERCAAGREDAINRAIEATP